MFFSNTLYVFLVLLRSPFINIGAEWFLMIQNNRRFKDSLEGDVNTSQLLHNHQYETCSSILISNDHDFSSFTRAISSLHLNNHINLA